MRLPVLRIFPCNLRILDHEQVLGILFLGLLLKRSWMPISKAKSNVLVQAYSFTAPAIAKALTEVRRGAKVEVILRVHPTLKGISVIESLPKMSMTLTAIMYRPAFG
jgi:hypothetical protein